MLENIEVNQNEDVCTVLSAFIQGDKDAISKFNEEKGKYMREEAYIELSSFMIGEQLQTLIHLAVDIDENEDKNFFIIADYSKNGTPEYTYLVEFSDAYEFYTKRKEAILLRHK